MGTDKPAGQKREIRVACAGAVELVPTGQLQPHPENPHRHPSKQVEKLAYLIIRHGWRHPIIVSTRSGFIIKGHCRLLAAKKLECEKVPVQYQDYDSLEQERADMIADNIIEEFGEWDGQKMADILCELDTANFPLAATALDQEQIENYVNGPKLGDHTPEPNPQKGLRTFECYLTEQQFDTVTCAIDEQIASGVDMDVANPDKRGNALYQILRNENTD